MEESINTDEAQATLQKSTPLQHRLVVTPGGTKYWIPQCDDAIVPRKGQKFDGLNEAVTFYRAYASTVGFDVRQSTLLKAKDKTVVWKYLVCSRQGYKNQSNTVQTMHPRRRRVSNRVGCNARIVLRVDGPGSYVERKAIRESYSARGIVSGGFD
ncbi:FAR1-related protein [Striga asiatica]|uniref:FAR1-related protein n=1 Tax=Striga asiatica TaxID=4170 RepID=A0A5A7P1B0_STRAF|nr:FAR1-related protein [Striga asiatica]